MYYTVHYRVAEVHVRVGHVELGAKHHRAFLRLGSVHLMEQLQALLHRPIPIWRRRAGLRGRTLLLGDLLARLLVYVSHALLNHPLGKFPKLLEIVRSVIYVDPMEAKPLDIFQYGVNILGVFLARVCVVEAQVAHSAVVLGHTEIHADGLGMAYVQIAVRLGREACLYPAAVLTFGQVVLYHLLYEAQALLLFRIFLFCNHICCTVLRFYGCVVIRFYGYKVMRL